MKDHYSIVIVGAGPAGSTFARRINSKKYDVLLINGSSIKGEKPCGGLLAPDAQDLLAEYDISLPKEILVSPQLFSVKTIDLETQNVRYYRRNYWNIDRAKFDRFLLDMVPDTVDIVDGICKSIREFKAEDNSNCNAKFLIDLQCQNQLYHISCDYIVGADGANSILKKTVFPNCRQHRYVAIQQWFESDLKNPFYSCIFDNETSPSCSWSFFKNEKLVFGGAFAINNCRKSFEMQKQKLEEKGFFPKGTFDNPLKTEACMVVRPHFLYGILHGNSNAYLIGEAAGFISSSSLEGISFAIASAEGLAKAYKSGRTSNEILKLYKKNTRKLYLKAKLKCLKRPFMYNKTLRNLILKSGVASIKIKI